ncbi:MAG TPA: 3-methyl-2-oxobutanoate hydroxymethyltransferase [Gammaproteobacteria bacterium]|nr:3-methyl-2-oxobutanoate hydroxymethyltransferase [Gammaproteobacteria bacterium]
MKLDANSLLNMKQLQPIAILTAYTCPVARCLEKAGIPAILVGDSVAMTEMGFSSTRQINMEHMVYHIGAVRRGAPNTHIIGDMPFDSDCDIRSATQNARRLLHAGADSIKLEGSKYSIISHLVENNMVVVGHTGLTPQTAEDFHKVGTTEQEAEQVYTEALGIEKAGAFMLVLEHIPATLASQITASVKIPTIGIGAGSDCDGQVLVINDAIGLGDKWPPFSKQYAHISPIIEQVARDFATEVAQGTSTHPKTQHQ